MAFFLHGKSYKGKAFTKKSANKIVTHKDSLKMCPLFEQMDMYCDGRVAEGPIVLSCAGKHLRDLPWAVQEPHLVISSSDLNSCSFAKGLANILFQDRCNIFIETSNLSKGGQNRLKLIIDDMLALFDNRVRIILCGKKSCLEEVTEKRFEDDNILNTGGSADQGKVDDDDGRVKIEELENALRVSQELLETKQGEFKTLEEKLGSVQVQFENMQRDKDYYKNISEINEKLCLSLKKDKIELQAESAEFRQKYNEEFSRIRLLQLENNSLLEKLQAVNSQTKSVQNQEIQTDLVEMIDKETKTDDESCVPIEKISQEKQCQTKKVGITDSYPTYLLKKIEENRNHSSADKVESCIRDFVCSTQFTKQSSNSVLCQVSIKKGKYIIDYKHLLTFEGYGRDIFDAKEEAFKAFILSLKEEAEK